MLITASQTDVLTLLTPASSRISFISPSSVGNLTRYSCSLARLKETSKTSGQPQDHLSPLCLASSSSSSLMISRPSDVTLKPCSTLAPFFRDGLVAEKQQKLHEIPPWNEVVLGFFFAFQMKSRILPNTLWETLGSRKLSGSSSSPSLSQARPFCDLPAFF